jgi:hypothetical protein
MAKSTAAAPKVDETPVQSAVTDLTKESRTLGLAQSTYAAEDLGSGFENLTQEDLAVPFIAILQKNSPQVEEGNGKLIPGAKAGMLINTVSNDLYDGKEGIRIIPVHRDRSYVEWIPRDDGGGFVGVHQPDDDKVKDAIKKAGRRIGKLKINDNNDLVETFGLYNLLLMPDGSFIRNIIAFTSTNIAAYKRLMTMAQSIQLAGEGGRPVIPPLFSHVYRLKTEFTQKKNFTWHKFIASFDGPNAAACRLDPQHPLYEQAKEFRALLMSGRASASYESLHQDAGGDGGDGAEPGTYQM